MAIEAAMDAGIGGSMRRLMSAVEGVGITIGDALAPALSFLADLFGVLASGPLVRVNGDQVEGVEKLIPGSQITVQIELAAALMTPDYQTTVENMVGTINAAQFLGRPAGSLLFSGFHGNERVGGTWTMQFNFLYSANAVNISGGESITVLSKKGWQHLWTLFEDVTDTTAKWITKRPRAAYVENIYAEGDFPQLLGYPPTPTTTTTTP